MHVPAGRRLALVVVLLGVLAAIALGAPSTASAAVSWAPAAERAVSSQQNCDPCTFIWVVRTGGGTVTSNIGSSVGNTGPTINCGSTCYGDFYSWELSRVVLTADGLFRGWEDCPEPNGNRCSIEFD